jgi:hypothetical protein
VGVAPEQFTAAALSWLQGDTSNSSSTLEHLTANNPDLILNMGDLVRHHGGSLVSNFCDHPHSRALHPHVQALHSGRTSSLGVSPCAVLLPDLPLQCCAAELCRPPRTGADPRPGHACQQ